MDVFISYSWDSDEHRQRVSDLVERLRKDRIDVIYDGDIQLGDRITHFMEDGVSKSDKVLYICTPTYKR